MSSQKIKKGDMVLIISGKDRGGKGKVLRVFPRDFRVLVEGINIRKRHIRPRRAGEKGQIIQVPAPLPSANVKLICPKCGKAARIGFQIEGSKKYRVCKKCRGEI